MFGLWFGVCVWGGGGHHAVNICTTSLDKFIGRISTLTYEWTLTLTYKSISTMLSNGMHDLWWHCHPWFISTPVPLPFPYLMLALELHSLRHWQLLSFHILNDSFFIDKPLKVLHENVALSTKNDPFKLLCKSKLTDNASFSRNVKSCKASWAA